MPLRLLEFCKSRRMTLSELARWTGIARVSLSRYAHGSQDVTLGQLLKIASRLGCRLSDLVDDREDLRSPTWQIALRKHASRSARKEDKSWVPRAMLAASRASGPIHEKA